MITSALDRLLSISTPSIGPEVQFRSRDGIMGEWLEFISKKNGFLAFESALLVRPAICEDCGVYSVKSWNSRDCWLETYEFQLPKMHCFAEDIFGEQFAISDNTIFRFDPETGELVKIGSSLLEWAQHISDHYNRETGFELAHEWQSRNGPLGLSERLIPKIPFVLGGDYSLSNLRKWDDRKGMRARGFLASRLRGLPDGTKITFVLDEGGKG